MIGLNTLTTPKTDDRSIQDFGGGLSGGIGDRRRFIPLGKMIDIKQAFDREVKRAAKLKKTAFLSSHTAKMSF